MDGKTYRLNEFASAKVLVVVFTCNHCPTAQAYEGRIKKLAADYREKGVAVVAISPNDPSRSGSTSSAIPTWATRSKT